jgi:hypothetical protein
MQTIRAPMLLASALSTGEFCGVGSQIGVRLDQLKSFRNALAALRLGEALDFQSEF